MNMTKEDKHMGFGETGEVSLADDSVALICETGEDGNNQESSNNKASEDDLEEEIPMSFPQRLMDILNDEEHSDVISWLPHGKGFIMYKKKKFAAQVLPKYFKQSKFTSFTRKLNRWGFVRVTRGPETGAYYHQFFQRGNLRLCMQMSCQSSSSKPGVVPPIPAIGGTFGGASSTGMANMLTLSNTPGDLAQQNQSMIRQQLHQLQLQQIELQQLQLQQQQQLQAAELLRQALAKQNGDISSEQNGSNSSLFQSLQISKEPDSCMMGTQPLSLYPTLQNNGTFASMGDSFLGGNGNGRGAWAA